MAKIRGCIVYVAHIIHNSLKSEKVHRTQHLSIMNNIVHETAKKKIVADELRPTLKN